ncbi:cyclic nucleotide-binding domain-containing protein [Candidatus Poribacteria bacterium]|nr:cyclic nucleotide-binding domain-containing protein [Candidatus Poribacteria bacterium]
MAEVSLTDLQRFQQGQPVGIFAGLADHQLTSIGEIVHRQRFGDGDVIISDGDEGDTMFLLLAGKARVTKKVFIKSARKVGEGEKEIILLPAEWNPYFGELALFDPRSLRTATVAAVGTSECGVIYNRDFIALADADHDLGYLVLKNVLQKQVGIIRKANENILNLITALSFALSASAQ